MPAEAAIGRGADEAGVRAGIVGVVAIDPGLLPGFNRQDGYHISGACVVVRRGLLMTSNFQPLLAGSYPLFHETDLVTTAR